MILQVGKVQKRMTDDISGSMGCKRVADGDGDAVPRIT